MNRAINKVINRAINRVAKILLFCALIFFSIDVGATIVTVKGNVSLPVDKAGACHISRGNYNFIAYKDGNKVSVFNVDENKLMIFEFEYDVISFIFTGNSYIVSVFLAHPDGYMDTETCSIANPEFIANFIDNIDNIDNLDTGVNYSSYLDEEKKSYEIILGTDYLVECSHDKKMVCIYDKNKKRLLYDTKKPVSRYYILNYDHNKYCMYFVFEDGRNLVVDLFRKKRLRATRLLASNDKYLCFIVDDQDQALFIFDINKKSLILKIKKDDNYKNITVHDKTILYDKCLDFITCLPYKDNKNEFLLVQFNNQKYIIINLEQSNVYPCEPKKCDCGKHIIFCILTNYAFVVDRHLGKVLFSLGSVGRIIRVKCFKDHILIAYEDGENNKKTRKMFDLNEKKLYKIFIVKTSLDEKYIVLSMFNKGFDKGKYKYLTKFIDRHAGQEALAIKSVNAFDFEFLEDVSKKYKMKIDAKYTPRLCASVCSSQLNNGVRVYDMKDKDGETIFNIKTKLKLTIYPLVPYSGIILEFDSKKRKFHELQVEDNIDNIDNIDGNKTKKRKLNEKLEE